MSELLAAVNGTVMYTTTAVLPMSTGVTDVSLEVTTEDLNISTTESPAPPWLQVTAACVGLASLNATGGDGPCIPGVSPGDNGSTSTAVAAAGPQCPVFVQPWALLLLAFPVMTVFGNVLHLLTLTLDRTLGTETRLRLGSSGLNRHQYRNLKKKTETRLRLNSIGRDRGRDRTLETETRLRLNSRQRPRSNHREQGRD